MVDDTTFINSELQLLSRCRYRRRRRPRYSPRHRRRPRYRHRLRLRHCRRPRCPNSCRHRPIRRPAHRRRYRYRPRQYMRTYPRYRRRLALASRPRSSGPLGFRSANDQRRFHPRHLIYTRLILEQSGNFFHRAVTWLCHLHRDRLVPYIGRLLRRH